MFPAYADSPRHALSLFGDPKYKPGFPHFDYVNPNAPKQGKVREAPMAVLTVLTLIFSKAPQHRGLALYTIR